MDEGILTGDPERSQLSRLIGWTIFSFGAVVTLSWMMGLPLLWLDGWPRKITRPNAGFGFMVAGLALRLIQKDRMNGVWRIPEAHLAFSTRRTVQLLGFVLVLLGGFTVLEHIFKPAFQIDTILIFQKWYQDISHAEARMTLLTSVEFLLTGISFLLIDKKARRNVFPSEAISVAVLAISLDSLITFLYMNDTFPDLRADHPIPVISSAAFVILSTGILASRQDRGIVAVWVAEYNGSKLVRKWLPVGIVVFILSGGIIDIMHDYNWLDPGTGLSIFTVVVISFITIVVLFSAANLNGFEKQLLHSNKLYAVLSESNQTMVRVRDRMELLQSVCDIMTRFGGFRMSCVWLRNGTEDTVKVDACSGADCDKIMKSPGFLKVFLEADGVSRVLHGDEYSVVNDLEESDIPDSVKEVIVGLGLRSAIVLNLRPSGNSVGVLIVCSSEAGFFGERELNLLREVSLDLSFALEGLEREGKKERAEKAMRESEERFRAMFERAAVGIVLLTPTGIVIRANPRFCKITGYAESDLAGRSFLDITYPEDAAKDRSNLDRMLEGEIQTYSTEKRYVRKDGTPVWAHLSAALVRAADGEPKNIISIVQDISEQKEAEALLRSSREQYQQFFEEDITADFIATADGEILSCNPAFARIFGFSSVDEAKRSNADDLYLSARHRKEFLQFLRDVGKIEHHEMTLRKKDGSEIYVIRSSFGIFDSKGNLVQTKNYLFDDTRRRMLERQMLQTQKMESLGTLAGGIAHDFNNILGIIMGHTSLLKRREVNDERSARSLDTIELATKRGAGLIRQLLTFARKEDRVFESIRVNEIIKDLHKLLEETLPKLVTIRLELTDELPLIVGDPTQIHQALLNLCVNARDAMLERKDGKPPGGMLSVSTSLIDGGTLRDRFPNAARDKYVMITVADTGVGMDETIRGHVFEPFFTTKERGKGTGLGLATVYGIVEGHEGFVDVSSEPGAGTSFSIYLPSRSPEASESAPHNIHGTEIDGGSETILIVEDEEMLTDFLAEILTRKGYKILTAPDGEMAVSIFAANFRKIDLVLSDLGLPKMGGEDMLRQLRRIDPDVRIIFASGFLEPEVKSGIARAGAKDFIQKPYSAAEVLTKVREILDS